MENEKKNDNDIVENEVDELDNGGATGTGDDAGAGKSESGNGGKPNGGASSKSNGKTFTQDQVTRISAREKSQGRAAALKELGIDPKDTKTLADVKAFLDGRKTDEQRAAEQRSQEQAAVVEAEKRATIAEAKAEAMMMGVKPQHVDDLVTLALAKMSDDSDLKTIIGEFKTKYPVWFGESEEDDTNGKGKAAKGGATGQKGTGSSIKDKGKANGSKEIQGLGARLAAQRKTSSTKSSYWGANKK